MQHLSRWNDARNNQAGNNAAESHVIMPREVLSNDDFLYIVMPYGGQELFDLIREPFTEQQTRGYMRQFLRVRVLPFELLKLVSILCLFSSIFI